LLSCVDVATPEASVSWYSSSASLLELMFQLGPILGATAGSMLYTFFFSRGGPINNLINMYTRTAHMVGKAMFGSKFADENSGKRDVSLEMDEQ